MGQCNDGYPDSLKVIGIIDEICPPINYSDTCSDRTAIINFSSDYGNYCNEKLFIIFPRVNNRDNYKGISVVMKVYKYYGTLPKYYMNKIHNIYDSKGIPFYYVRDKIKI
ncbi:MAG: hypothetical protein WAR79_19160 [Melioribacteraceae bacterium]